MKDVLTRLIADAPTPIKARNILREYLQARVLARLQREGAMIPLALHGGTALRLAYLLPRSSEDLKFSLEGDPATYDLRKYAAAIKSELQKEAYELETSVRVDGGVQTASIQFPGLLNELELSALRGEAFGLQLEVDTRPPDGAELETTVVRHNMTLHLQHHDQSSLLAGKIYAILMGSFAKGRDLFDLMWCLADPDWPAPNLQLLNNALSQPGKKVPKLTKTNWREITIARIREVDWDAVRRDVTLLVDKNDQLRLMTRDNLIRIVERS
jgi:hypothetical protein